MSQQAGELGDAKSGERNWRCIPKAALRRWIYGQEPGLGFSAEEIAAHVSLDRCPDCAELRDEIEFSDAQIADRAQKHYQAWRNSLDLNKIEQWRREDDRRWQEIVMTAGDEQALFKTLNAGLVAVSEMIDTCGVGELGEIHDQIVAGAAGKQALPTPERWQKALDDAAARTGDAVPKYPTASDPEEYDLGDKTHALVALYLLASYRQGVMSVLEVDPTKAKYRVHWSRLRTMARTHPSRGIAGGRYRSYEHPDA